MGGRLWDQSVQVFSEAGTNTIPLKENLHVESKVGMWTDLVWKTEFSG